MQEYQWRLGDGFWNEFVSETWERRPTVLRRPFPRDLVTEEEGLRFLRKAFADTEQPAGKEFFVGYRKQDPPADDLLPGPGESSIDAFASRLARDHGLRNFQFVVYALQRFDPAPWFRTRTVLAPLIERVGLPSGDVNTDSFFGDYRETAAGLHKDNASVFSYVVHGTKTMLVWPFEHFADQTENPDARHVKEGLPHIDYRKHLDAAIRLQGRPGDLLYWPSSYWHIGVGDGQPHMTFNLSLYFPYRPRARVDEVLSFLIDPQLQGDWVDFYPYEPASIQEMAGGLPGSWARALEVYERTLSSPRFRGMLLASWLRRLTGGGFSAPPAKNPDTAVRPLDLFVGRADAVIVHAPVEGGRTMVAANGGVFLADSPEPIRRVIEHRDSGQPFSAASIAAEAGGTGDDAQVDAIASLLSRLLAHWAIQRERLP